MLDIMHFLNFRGSLLIIVMWFDCKKFAQNVLLLVSHIKYKKHEYT
jgi:hypothetical protein